MIKWRYWRTLKLYLCFEHSELFRDGTNLDIIVNSTAPHNVRLTTAEKKPFIARYVARLSYLLAVRGTRGYIARATEPSDDANRDRPLDIDAITVPARPPLTNEQAWEVNTTIANSKKPRLR